VLEPDPQVPLVACAFGRYATGSTSVAALTEALAEKGLRNRHENALTLLRTIEAERSNYKEHRQGGERQRAHREHLKADHHRPWEQRREDWAESRHPQGAMWRLPTEWVAMKAYMW